MTRCTYTLSSRILLLVLLLSPLCSCVQRRIIIDSAPPGATVFIDGEEKGLTPIQIPFTYYGKNEIKLVLPGHVTLLKEQVPIKRPLYQYFPLDLFFEVIWPFTLKDHHAFSFNLDTESSVTRHDLTKRAQELKNEAFNREIEQDQ